MIPQFFSIRNIDFTFPREESRMHIHVYSSDGEAKFWLEPVVGLANYYGLSEKQLRETQKIVEERRMKLSSPGRSTSKAEVTQITLNGIWMSINDEEFFISYKDFPWFKRATVAQIHNVSILHERHLHWPGLDVDLHVDSLKDIEKHPLLYIK